MLVLARREGERILIGEGPDQIEIMVTEVRGDTIRIGVKAPKHLRVDREEVRVAKDADVPVH